MWLRPIGLPISQCRVNELHPSREMESFGNLLQWREWQSEQPSRPHFPDQRHGVRYALVPARFLPIPLAGLLSISEVLVSCRKRGSVLVFPRKPSRFSKPIGESLPFDITSEAE